jgi:HAE1 family hydrophobic/amphiphilic exporter-1
VLDALGGIEGLFNITSDAAVDAPEITVEVDPERAALRGLSTVQVATALRALMSGQEVAQVRTDDGSAMSLVVRGDPDATATAELLRELPLAAGPAPVLLGDIATIEEAPAPTQLSRVDGRPAVSISADVTEQDVGAVTGRVDEVVDGLALPAGVEVGAGGVAAQMQDAFGSLGIALIAAIILVYLVMTISFGSLVDPFIILFSIPLAAVGALVALFITGRPLGLSALIGVLMLVGIVVTNAIVLLDFVEQARERGARVREALLEAGRIRVRPILMTALATILALIPLSLGLNEGAIIAAELGTVVIGGLISSTFLTLVVIPVIYSYLKRDHANETAPGEPAAAGLPPAVVTEAGGMAAAVADPRTGRAVGAPGNLAAGGRPALGIGRLRPRQSQADGRARVAAGGFLAGGLFVALLGGLRRTLARFRG